MKSNVGKRRGRGSESIAHVAGQVKGFDALPRDRVVPAMSVHCPSCGAEIGIPCISEKGTTTRHVARRRMALRAGY